MDSNNSSKNNIAVWQCQGGMIHFSVPHATMHFDEHTFLAICSAFASAKEKILERRQESRLKLVES